MSRLRSKDALKVNSMIRATHGAAMSTAALIVFLVTRMCGLRDVRGASRVAIKLFACATAAPTLLPDFPRVKRVKAQSRSPQSGTTVHSKMLGQRSSGQPEEASRRRQRMSRCKTKWRPRPRFYRVETARVGWTCPRLAVRFAHLSYDCLAPHAYSTHVVRRGKFRDALFGRLAQGLRLRAIQLLNE